MGKVRNEIISYYKRNASLQFSKNLWLDLLVHAGIGLATGTLIFLLRGTNPMPTLLLVTTVSMLWGFRSWLKNSKQKNES